MNRPTQAHHGHGGMPPPPRHGLARYGSAPGSFLAALSEVVRGDAPSPSPAQHQHHHQPQQQQQQAVSRFFSGESSGLTSCESTSRPDVPTLHRAYGGSGEIHVPPPALAPPPQQQQSGLLRHSSSPAGLLSRLVGDPHGNGGMAGTRAVMGSYSQGAGGNINVMTQQQSRLSSQWSFSRQDMMPHITEMGMATMPGTNDIGESIANGSAGAGCNSSSDLSRSFSMSSWDDTTSIMFSSPNKRARVAVDGDDANFSNIDSQFGLSSSSLEMPGMDEYLQMQDSIACRVRAKRGCATHPRSIAERERRTRISKRLRKLQELVPNMDKQTNTSEMLDIAVDYIKVLQEQIEKLKQDQENCSCSAKQEC
ncbi:transcription factor bHLH128 [Lolium perenne]|uniref:transcription factor bHLH128 n=1 Tax=Lolium perenne TaxID=4522 RepID=UPI0021F591D5|nr:transcription factor bHLH128-like [Lolium perenne]